MLNQRLRSGSYDWTVPLPRSAGEFSVTKKPRFQRTMQIGFGKMKRLAPLTIEERIEGPDRVVLLRGSADILCLSPIQDLFGRYSKEKIRLLLVDLSATEFINSPVWAVVTLYARKKAGECRVAIVGMPDRIKGSFEMMGLHKELETFPTAEIARRELGF